MTVVGVGVGLKSDARQSLCGHLDTIICVRLRGDSRIRAHEMQSVSASIVPCGFSGKTTCVGVEIVAVSAGAVDRMREDQQRATERTLSTIDFRNMGERREKRE